MDAPWIPYRKCLEFVEITWECQKQVALKLTNRCTRVGMADWRVLAVSVMAEHQRFSEMRRAPIMTASGNGAVTFGLHIASSWRTVPEQYLQLFTPIKDLKNVVFSARFIIEDWAYVSIR